MLHVKLIVYYTVSFTCNIQFLNSTYFVFINLRAIAFSVSFAVGYMLTELCLSSVTSSIPDFIRRKQRSF